MKLPNGYDCWGNFCKGVRGRRNFSVTRREFPDSELVLELARFLPCREGQCTPVLCGGRALCYESIASRKGLPRAEAEDICRVAAVCDAHVDGADGIHGLKNLPLEVVNSRLIRRYIRIEVVNSRLHLRDDFFYCFSQIYCNITHSLQSPLVLNVFFLVNRKEQDNG